VSGGTGKGFTAEAAEYAEVEERRRRGRRI